MSISNENIDKDIKDFYTASQLAFDLCKDLISADKYGFQVTPEIRNRAREVFGIEVKE